MIKILIVTGKISGDKKAAEVVKEIKKMKSDVEFAAMGSKFLKQEGVKLLIDSSESKNKPKNSKIIKNLRKKHTYLRILKKYIKNKKPDVIFLINYSEFNIFIARAAKKRNIPVVFYSPPAAWLWGEWRAKWIAKTGAIIAASFPMEREIYNQAGAEVKFVGHPLLDKVNIKENGKKIGDRLEIKGENPVISLIPGNSSDEIKRYLSPMLKAAAILQKERPELQFVIFINDSLNKEEIISQITKYELIIKVVSEATFEVIKISDLAIVCSDKKALEAAILNTPMVITYKNSSLKYKLKSYFLKSNFTGIPNIIAGKEIVPELIQDEVTGERIYQEVNGFLNKPYLNKRIKDKLAEVAEELGESGAIENIAKLILSKAKNKE